MFPCPVFCETDLTIFYLGSSPFLRLQCYIFPMASTHPPCSLLPLAGVFLQLLLKCGHKVLFLTPSLLCPPSPALTLLIHLHGFDSHLGGSDSYTDLRLQLLSSPHFYPLQISTWMFPRNLKLRMCPMTNCPSLAPPYQASSSPPYWVIGPCKGSESPKLMTYFSDRYTFSHYPFW